MVAMSEGKEDPPTTPRLMDSPNRITDARFPTALSQQALRPTETQEHAPSETTNGIRDRALREEHRLPSAMRLAAAVARPFQDTVKAKDDNGETSAIGLERATNATTTNLQLNNKEEPNPITEGLTAAADTSAQAIQLQGMAGINATTAVTATTRAIAAVVKACARRAT